mmetsp:Transcript_6030/g.21467  ORF Transcript_6030/g.21467 Transcript_6030/m.21467 type:complete len:895 (-) Transcript_6030:93-2777(-)
MAVRRSKAAAGPDEESSGGLLSYLGIGKKKAARAPATSSNVSSSKFASSKHSSAWGQHALLPREELYYSAEEEEDGGSVSKVRSKASKKKKAPRPTKSTGPPSVSSSVSGGAGGSSAERKPRATPVSAAPSTGRVRRTPEPLTKSKKKSAPVRSKGGKKKAALRPVASAGLGSESDEDDSAALVGKLGGRTAEANMAAGPPASSSVASSRISDQMRKGYIANPSQALFTPADDDKGTGQWTSAPPFPQARTVVRARVGGEEMAATKIQAGWRESRLRRERDALERATKAAADVDAGASESVGKESEAGDEGDGDDDDDDGVDDLGQWLEAFRLGGLKDGLTALGVRELADVTDLEDDDLSEMGLSVVQKRRFKRAVDSLSLDVGSEGVSAEDVSTAAAAAGVTAIKPKEVKLLKQAGQGSYGIVYKARWRGSEVAVKVLRATLTGAALRGAEAEVTKELQMMKRVGNHRNVVSLLGLCHMNYPPRLAIVTDLMARGSLWDVLQGKSGPVPDLTELVRMSAAAAAGIGHLHAEDVIHRDIAARNILVSEHNEVRVADFGFARVLAEAEDVGVTASTIGPVRWMAPESLRLSQYSAQSDVYAFGCMLFEVVTGGKQPWDGLSLAVAGQRVLAGQTLDATLPPDCDPTLRAVMRACWAFRPTDRPTMEQVRDALEQRAGELARGVRASSATGVFGVAESKVADAPAAPASDALRPPAGPAGLAPPKYDEFDKESRKPVAVVPPQERRRYDDFAPPVQEAQALEPAPQQQMQQQSAGSAYVAFGAGGAGASRRRAAEERDELPDTLFSSMPARAASPPASSAGSEGKAAPSPPPGPSRVVEAAFDDYDSYAPMPQIGTASRMREAPQRRRARETPAAAVLGTAPPRAAGKKKKGKSKK